MSPLMLSAIIAAVLFGSCILGIFTAPLMPEAHLSVKTLERIKDARALVVGLTGLTLGLLVAGANSSFEEKAKEIKTQAANVILTDRYLRDFGPSADSAREQLRITVQKIISQVNDAEINGSDPKKIFTNIHTGKIRGAILKLSPQGDGEAWLKSSALSALHEFSASRWRIYQEMNSNIKWPLVYVVVFWLIAIFFSIGVDTPKNVFAASGMFISAVAMAGAIYLMLEMDMPFHGYITLSAAPLESAAQLIGGSN